MHHRQKHFEFTQVNTLNMRKWIKELKYNSLSKKEKLASIPKIEIDQMIQQNQDKKSNSSCSNDNDMDIDIDNVSLPNLPSESNDHIWTSSLLTNNFMNFNVDDDNHWRISNNQSGPRSSYRLNVRPISHRLDLQFSM